ncbi:MAG: FAD-dependent oxidoreductase [Desulfobacterales bacterium]|nr:FAD-dependent oxidoreductase [Desulfobacterales bacterium]
MKWHLTTDVIVVGAGYAGTRAAIAAHDAGAKVLILEKLSHPGGISVMSAGAVLFVTDRSAATEYFRHLSGGRVSETMIAAFAKGLADNLADMQQLARVDGASFIIQERPGIYPFPGRECLGGMRVTHVPGFKEFSWYPSASGYNGAKLMAMLLDNLKDRQISIQCDTAVQKLVVNSHKLIVGVEAQHNGNQLNIQARKGVVLACGGFEFDEWAKSQFLETKPFYSMGSLASTGDGLRMAQDLGARLWHMWHTHNSYGFKYDDFQLAFRHSIGGPRSSSGVDGKVSVMPWIVVDTFGHRFMNEFPPAPQDTSGRPLAHFDPDLPGHPRIPCYLIFDDEGRRKRPVGAPLGFPEQFPGGKRYKWSHDNSKEIEKGWVVRSDSIRELAAVIKQQSNNSARMDSEILAQTVDQWNAAVDKGEDAAFQRYPDTMMPIKTPPFYCMEAWPIITNTQGGPEHNADRQVIDVWGHPIARLYTAGELGSFFGHIYELSGNIGECFSSGRIAGKAAAGEISMDPSD